MSIGRYYNYWDYWGNYHKVTFDGVNKLILVNPGVTELDVKVDIYSDWKEWFTGYDSVITSKYIQASESVGGQPLPGGEYLGGTFFLINGWRIKPYPGSYRLIVNGNLYTDTGEDVFVDADVVGRYPNNIRIQSNVAVLATEREVEVPTLTSDNISDLAAAVWDELLSLHGDSGSTGEALAKIKNNAALIPATV
jgi:hypothetical protein